MNFKISEKGFSMLSFSFLIPIAFFFCMVILASYHIITKYTQIQSECRSHVLGAQQVLGKKLKELMDLNKNARELRAEEAKLRATILSLSAFPPATVPFVELLDANLIRQGLLRTKQEGIILSANLQARKIMEELPPKINHVKYSSVGLKVYKSPLAAIAPDHLPVPFFTEFQTIKVSWQYSIGEFVPGILLDLFAKTNYPKTVEGKCAATLIKKGDVWNPKLHLVRF
jgi:hypothetical protein